MSEAAGTNWGSERRIAAAARWERPSAELGRGVTDALVEIAAARPGLHVLDVACGTGAPALQLARRVGPGGRVVAIDIAAEPLKIAAARAGERGLSNVRFESADVHQLPFAESEFDLVTSRFGVMFFADLPRALREIHRVLRPGGRVAVAAWGPFEQPNFRTTAHIVMRHTGRPLPPAAAAMFSFAVPGTMSRAFREAGFADAKDDIHTVPWIWTETVEEFWAYFQAITVPFRPVVEAIRPEQRAAIDSDVRAAVAEYWDGKQVNMTAEIVLATATKS
jgi:ubiquinone/menaquinone biosynthesis C-methylase UbiE